MYLGTNGSRVDNVVAKVSRHVDAGCTRPAMPLWRTERYNDDDEGGGYGYTIKGRNGKVEGNGIGRGLGGSGMSQSYVSAVRTPATPLPPLYLHFS